MQEQMAEFKIASKGSSDYIMVKVLSRQYPGATEYNDANWLCSEVKVVAGGFKANVSGYLVADEFPPFRDGLEKLNKTLAGKVEYYTLEDWLSIKIEGDGKGHISLEAELLDKPGSDNRLTFSFELDQTFLPEIIRGLGQVISQYPVCGSRL